MLEDFPRSCRVRLDIRFKSVVRPEDIYAASDKLQDQRDNLIFYRGDI